MEVRWIHRRSDGYILETKTWTEGKNMEVDYPFIRLYEKDQWGRFEAGTVNMLERSVVYRDDRAHNYAQRVYPLDKWVKWGRDEIKFIVMEEE